MQSHKHQQYPHRNFLAAQGPWYLGVPLLSRIWHPRSMLRIQAAYIRCASEPTQPMEWHPNLNHIEKMHHIAMCLHPKNTTSRMGGSKNTVFAQFNVTVITRTRQHCSNSFKVGPATRNKYGSPVVVARCHHFLLRLIGPIRVHRCTTVQGQHPTYVSRPSSAQLIVQHNGAKRTNELCTAAHLAHFTTTLRVRENVNVFVLRDVLRCAHSAQRKRSPAEHPHCTSLRFQEVSRRSYALTLLKIPALSTAPDWFVHFYNQPPGGSVSHLLHRPCSYTP